jgi:hypothetical protein
MTNYRRLVLRLALRFKRQDFTAVIFRDIDESTQPGSVNYPLWMETFGQHDISGRQISLLTNAVNRELASLRAERGVLAGLRSQSPSVLAV